MFLSLITGKSIAQFSLNSKLYFHFFCFFFTYLSHCAARGYGAAYAPRAKPLALNDLPRYNDTKKALVGWEFIPSPVGRRHRHLVSAEMNQVCPFF